MKAIMVSTWLLIVVLGLSGCGDDVSDVISNGDVTRLEELIAEGLDPNSDVSFQHNRFAGGKRLRRSLLVAASVFGQVDIVYLLLDSGVDLADPHNAFAICPAVAFGHKEIVQALIASGVNVNPAQKCGRHGDRSPLDFAEARGDSDLVRMLKEAGAFR